MRREERDVIIPCYHKRSLLVWNIIYYFIQELELKISWTNIPDYSLYFQYSRLRPGKHPMFDCNGTLVPFPLIPLSFPSLSFYAGYSQLN